VNFLEPLGISASVLFYDMTGAYQPHLAPVSFSKLSARDASNIW